MAALAVGAWGVSTGMRAQEPLNPPVPFAAAPASISDGRVADLRMSAQRAQEMGFSSEAANIYRELLALPGANRVELTLAAATALLEGGWADQASELLEKLPEPHSSAWELRMGLAALQQKKYEVVRPLLGPQGKIKEAELPVTDYPWYWFLEGAYVDLFDPQGTGRANSFYLRAENAAPNELARARFQLAGAELRLWHQSTTADDLKKAGENYETYRGRTIGYSYGIDWALMLEASGQHTEAMGLLQTIWGAVPKQDKEPWDRVRFTLGVIGQRGRSSAGQSALKQLLANTAGSEPLRQRQALQMLWEAAKQDPAREQLRADLDRLIALTPAHPILEDVLFYRAQMALSMKDYPLAEQRTAELLAKFPASRLRVHAYGLLTQVAWEQRRYRVAADNARKARAELANAKRPEDIVARGEFGVVEAEARYRAGDFRNAADAYAAALHEKPATAKTGDLMFQRVLAEIKSGSNDAAKVLDEVETNPEFDVENRWQAEWSLARALLVQGKSDEAYARVDKLLEAKDAAGVNPELRARLTWLRVRLSFEADHPEQTVTQVDELLKSLDGVNPSLSAAIASTALLHKGEAQLALWRKTTAPKEKSDYEAAALATLKKVREDYKGSDAAVQSFQDEAEYLVSKDQIVEALKRLRSLAENPDFQKNRQMPYALLTAARYAERLGQPKDLQDANKYIEDLVNSPAAEGQDELKFNARLMQGEVRQKLNDFSGAQQIFESLLDKPASVENQMLAKLALGKIHHAQSFESPLHAQQAQHFFEDVCYRFDAPVDLKVEAGYMLGELHARRGEAQEALSVWWKDVVDPFLIADKKPFETGAKRPYWLGRTLMRFGELEERQGNLEEAKRAYALILEKKLGEAEGAAKAALAILAPSVGKQ